LPGKPEASQPQQSGTRPGRGASGQQQKAVSVGAVETAEAVAETDLADPGKIAVVGTVVPGIAVAVVVVGIVVVALAEIVVAVAGIVVAVAGIVVVAEIAAAGAESVAFLGQSWVSVC